MGVKVSDAGGGDFKILDPGTYPAVCTQVIGIGPQMTGFGLKEKIKVRFEVPSERIEYTDGDGKEIEGPAIIWVSYTASLNERALLRRDLVAWRGRDFAPEELEEFDMDKILGAPCLISVVHKTNETTKKVYANVDAIAQLMKGQEKPKAEGKLVGFDCYSHTNAEYEDLPEWLQKTVDNGLVNIEAKATAHQSTLKAEVAEAQALAAFDDDDIPF